MSLGSLDRGANGLMKVGEAGVTGLNGARSGIWGWMSCCMKRDQSWRLDCSSPGRNRRVVGPVSFGALKAAVLLERRFRALSNSGSGSTLMTRVGRTGPCLRWASIWTWQSAIVLIGCCCIGSVSSCRRPTRSAFADWLSSGSRTARQTMGRTYFGLVDGEKDALRRCPRGIPRRGGAHGLYPEGGSRLRWLSAGGSNHDMSHLSTRQ